MFETIPQSIIGFFITSLLIWRLIPIAQKFNFVDKPGGHKRHQGHVPFIGGLGMFLGIIGTLIMIDLPIEVHVGPILFACLLVLIVGALDDKYFLSSYVRLLTQIGAALIIVTGDNAMLFDLGHLASQHVFYLGSWAIPLTVFATVGTINAVNMTDGLDGLAGGLSIVTLSAITILLMNGAANGFFVIPLILIAVVSAFLMFNLRTPWLHKARIFMGNGGSMLLGVLLAWLLIKFSQGSMRAFDPVIALWIFAIPLLDTVTIMLRRLLRGNSPFSSDREHLHHLFLKLGFTVGQSVIWVLSIASALAAFGVICSYVGVSESLLFFSFLAFFILYFWCMEKSWKWLYTRQTSQPSMAGGADNSIITPLKREKCLD